MPNLLDRLSDTARANPPYIEPRYSRKTKRVTLTVYLGDLPMEVSVPLKYLDVAIDRVCGFSQGTGPLQRLLDGLLHARQKYGHIIDGRKRPRGVQAGRRMILLTLKYASVWAYEFVKREWEKKSQDRYTPLQKAEKQFKALSGHACNDPIEMAAFLVFHAYKNERIKHNIKTPWNDTGDFSSENYARRYINTEPGQRIIARINRNPTPLSPLPKQRVSLREGDNFQEVWKTACKNGRLRNPLLQKIFAPWSEA